MRAVVLNVYERKLVPISRLLRQSLKRPLDVLFHHRILHESRDTQQHGASHEGESTVTGIPSSQNIMSSISHSYDTESTTPKFSRAPTTMYHERTIRPHGSTDVSLLLLDCRRSAFDKSRRYAPGKAPI